MGNYIKHCLVLVLLLVSGINYAQNVNRPVPGGFPPYEFVKYDTSFNGVYLSAPFFAKQVNPFDNSMSIFDDDGFLLWYSTADAGTYTDFKYHENHNLYTVTNRTGASGFFKVIDTNFLVIDSITPINGFTIDIHEFQMLDNGDYLISGKSDSIVDLSAYILDGSAGSDTTHIRGFTIQRFDPVTHNLLFQWNSNDHIDPIESYEVNYGYNIADFDYCHGNAVELDSDGNYLISFRHTNSIYKIDGVTGNVIWKLGGKNSSFVFTNDLGFSGQHDIRRLPNGNVSIFDNGNMSSSQLSRAVEYVLDTIAWEATMVWEYFYNSTLFSKAMGNNHTTSDDFHLINYGRIFRPSPSFVLIDDNDDLISEMYYTDTVYSYRSFAYNDPPSFNRPNVACENNSGLITLTADAGFDNYLWSNGGTAASIVVSDTGVYQVYVNKGIGMLGSEPVVIEDVNTFCISNSLLELDGMQLSDDEVEVIFDLLGRKVNYRINGQIYLVKYKSGKVSRVLWRRAN